MNKKKVDYAAQGSPRGLLVRLARARRGATGLALAAAVVPLVGLLGIATDAARGYMVKARLSQALDSAGLAGAQLVHEPDNVMKAEIDMFFGANFPPGFMGATLTGPSYTVDAGKEKVTLTASATINTSFVRVLGFKTLSVTSSTEVTRKTQYLDVVLAIDMSGSMGWNIAGQSGVPDEDKRIFAARNAAKELVNVLFGDAPTKELLKIGVVPWNAKVNVTTNGTTFDPALNNQDFTVGNFNSTPTYLNPTGGPQNFVWFANNSFVPLMSAPPTDWQGCVYSRFVDDGNSDNDADIFYGSLDSGNGDWRAWEPIGPEGEPVPGSAKCALSVDNKECRSCLNHGITPLTNVKQGAIDAIDELTSPTGTTNITQGLGWAWRVLMPDSPFTQAVPDADLDGERVQAIVLLTDGQNWGGSGDGYKAIWGEGSTGTPQINMDDRLKTLAANIKADNVIIYAIQFAFSDGDLATLMKQVATSDASPYYHYAPDGDALKAVFKTVANNLSELRLSK